MSQPGSNTTLSLPARLLISLGPPATILACALSSPKSAFCAPLTFIPTALAYHKYRDAIKNEPANHVELEPLIWTYALSATIGVTAVASVQAAVGYGVATLIYGTGDARAWLFKETMRGTTVGLDAETVALRAKMAWSWKYLTTMATMLFVGAGLGEELLKMLPVLLTRWRKAPDQRKPRKWTYLDYVMASSLAFGIAEGIIFIDTAYSTETGGKLALSLAERLLLGSTGHVLMAVLAALRATRKEYCGEKKLSWWRVMAPSALVHGAFDVAALLFSAWEGNPGWVHPVRTPVVVTMLASACSFWIGTAWLVRREFRLIAAHDEKKE